MTMSTNFHEQPMGVAGKKLDGRVALVTGGTRGIGAAICRSLASQGASVAAGYSGNQDRAEQFAKEFERDFKGPRATVHQGNVSSPQDCQRVVQEVLAQHGRIDILVNNAGITMDKMALKMSVQEWDAVIGVNLSGSFYMAQPVLEHMVVSKYSDHCPLHRLHRIYARSGVAIPVSTLSDWTGAACYWPWWRTGSSPPSARWELDSTHPA